MAFSVREGDRISVMALDVDSPDHAHASLKAALMTDEQAKFFLTRDTLNRLARVDWLGWVTPERLLLATNLKVVSATPWGGWRPGVGAIYGLDYDGSNASLMLTGRNEEGGVRIVCPILGSEGEVLIQAGRDLEAFDGMTGRRRRLSDDRASELQQRWKIAGDALRPLWRSVQQEMKAAFPTYEVSAVEQPLPTNRILVRVQHIADPGAFVVYDRDQHKAWNILRCAGDEDVNAGAIPAEEFDRSAEDGTRFTGVLVYPRNPRIERAPVVYWVPEKLGRRNRRDYVPQIHALAQMGFAVVLLDGVAQTRSGRAAHVNEAEERQHLVAAVSVLSAHYPLSQRAVALAGIKHGAMNAWRTAHAAPGAFRAVALIDIEGEDTDENERGHSPVSLDGTRLGFWTYAGPDAYAGRDRNYMAWHATAGAFERRGGFVTWRKLGSGYRTGQPNEQAAAFREVETFLMENLYRYAVELGELRPISTEESP